MGIIPKKELKFVLKYNLYANKNRFFIADY